MWITRKQFENMYKDMIDTCTGHILSAEEYSEYLEYKKSCEELEKEWDKGIEIANPKYKCPHELEWTIRLDQETQEDTFHGTCTNCGEEVTKPWGHTTKVSEGVIHFSCDKPYEYDPHVTLMECDNLLKHRIIKAENNAELLEDRLDDLEGDIRTLTEDLADSEYSFLQMFKDRDRTLEMYGNFFEQQLIFNSNILRRLQEVEDDRGTKTKAKRNVSSSTRKTQGKSTKGTSNKTTKGV
jgi:hypothetical protein